MPKSRPRVVYLNNIPSPYTVDRFNAVADRGNLDFTAWFCSRTASGRSWDVNEVAWRFPAAYLPGGTLSIPGVGSRYVNLPLPLITHRPDLVVSLYDEPVFLLAWGLARCLGARTAFRVLPMYDTWIKRTRAKESLKRWLFPRVDGFKVPGPDGAAFAQRYNADARRIHPVTQSIDVERFAAGHTRWSPEREAIRNELGVSGCVFIYVGRLVEEIKGISYLLEAFRQARCSRVPMSLLMVGDGPDEGRYRAYCREHRLDTVVFTGFVQQEGLPRLYAAADALVFPTLGDGHGLVVEEAMASHLPVISSRSAGDITLRVPEGEAGFVVPPAAVAPMRDRMLTLAKDEQLRRRMGETAFELARTKGHVRYAEDFERFVDRVLSSPSARPD
jgi:glycosyltransferase involved in cell wall biosynthesis